MSGEKSTREKWREALRIGSRAPSSEIAGERVASLGSEALKLIEEAAAGFIDDPAADFPTSAVLEALDRLPSPRHSRFLNNAIRNAIRHGQRSGWWNYEALPRAFIARPEPAPLNEGSERDLAAAEELVNCLLDALPSLLGPGPSRPAPQSGEPEVDQVEPSPKEAAPPEGSNESERVSDVVHMGALIVSAALLGALFDKRLLNALPKGLLSATRRARLVRLRSAKGRVPDPVDTSPRRVHVEVELRIKDDERLARRWFLDPGSQLLFDALFCQPRPKELPSAAVAVAAFGAHVGQRLSLDKLVRLAATRWAWELPPLLWHAAKDAFGFTSLPISTWERLFLSRTQTRKAAPQRKPSLPHVWLPRRVGSEARAQDEAALDLIRLFGADASGLRLDRAAAGKRVTMWMREHESDGAWLSLLGHWALWLMSRDKLHGKKLRPSSVQRYLSAVARPLLGLVHDLDPQLVDEVELEEKLAGFSKLFRTPAARRYNVARLWGFLSWAHASAGVVMPDLPDLDSADINEHPRPHANLLTPLEYAAVYNSLQALSADPRQRAMLRLMLALSYRCGLRWGTVWKLTRSQVTADAAYLLVRPNAYSKGKSDADRRWVPLKDLLHVQERKALLAWIKQVDGENSRLNGEFLMFHERGAPQSIVPVARCHDLLLEMIREASGDNTMRIHDLRHSALSFFMLRLFSRDGYPSLSTLLPASWVGVDQELARGDDGFAIALTLTSGMVPTRALGYLLAMLAGHASAETSIHHYCHLLDWWLFQYSRDRTPVLSNALSSALLGIPADHVRRSTTKHVGVDGRRGLTLTQVADRLSLRHSDGSPRMRRIRTGNAPPLLKAAAPLSAVRDIADAGFAEALGVVNSFWADPAKASKGLAGSRAVRLAKLIRTLSNVLAASPQLRAVMQEAPDPRLLPECDKAYRQLLTYLKKDGEVSKRLIEALSACHASKSTLVVEGESKAKVLVQALTKAGLTAKQIEVLVFLSQPKRHDQSRSRWAARLGPKSLDVEFGPRNRSSKDHAFQLSVDTTSSDLKSGLGLWLIAVLVLAACVAQTASTGFPASPTAPKAGANSPKP